MATAALSRDSLIFLDPDDLKIVHVNAAAQKQLGDAKSVLRSGIEVKQILAYLAKNGEFTDGDPVSAVRTALAAISSGKHTELPGFRMGKTLFLWHCDTGPGNTIALVLRDDGRAQELAKALADHKTFIQHLIDVLPAPIYLKNRENVVTRCNGAFAALFGLETKAVTGKQLAEIAPESLAQTIRDHEAPLQKEEEVRDEISFVLDDVERTALFAAATLKGPSGAIAGTIGSLIDVTSLKQAQAEVAEASERLTGLLETAPIGVGISCRDSGEFKFFNSTFSQMLGLDNDKKPCCLNVIAKSRLKTWTPLVNFKMSKFVCVGLKWPMHAGLKRRLNRCRLRAKKLFFGGPVTSQNKSMLRASFRTRPTMMN